VVTDGVCSLQTTHYGSTDKGKPEILAGMGWDIEKSGFLRTKV